MANKHADLIKRLRDGADSDPRAGNMRIEAADALEADAKPLTQSDIEQLAHRTCSRYVFLDTDAPYHFNGHTLMDFVGAVLARDAK